MVKMMLMSKCWVIPLGEKRKRRNSFLNLLNEFVFYSVDTHKHTHSNKKSLMRNWKIVFGSAKSNKMEKKNKKMPKRTKCYGFYFMERNPPKEQKTIRMCDVCLKSASKLCQPAKPEHSCRVLLKSQNNNKTCIFEMKCG